MDIDTIVYTSAGLIFYLLSIDNLEETSLSTLEKMTLMWIGAITGILLVGGY